MIHINDFSYENLKVFRIRISSKWVLKYKFWLGCNNKQEVGFQYLSNFMSCSLIFKGNFAAVIQHYSVNWKQTLTDYMTVKHVNDIEDMEP